MFRLADSQVAEHWEVVDYSGLQRVGIPIRPSTTTPEPFAVKFIRQQFQQGP